MAILKNTISLGLIIATGALSAADYTLIKNSDRSSGNTWWSADTFQDAEGNKVVANAMTTATLVDGKVTAVNPITNLSFKDTVMSVFLNGSNNGLYFVNNLKGSTTEAQTITFITNSCYQNPHIANITGTSSYKLTVNFGLSSAKDTIPNNDGLYKQNTPFRTYTEFNTTNGTEIAPNNTTTTTTYSYANVNVYAGLLANRLNIKNSSVLTINPNTARDTISEFKSITVDKTSSIVFYGGSDLVGGKYRVHDYINLNGTADFYGDKGNFIIQNKIRFDGGTLRLHGSELLTANTAGTSAISLNVYGGGARIELGGNESFDYIAFNKDVKGTIDVDGKSKSLYKDSTRVITFVLADTTTELSINSLFKGLTDDYTTALNGKDAENLDGSTYSWTTFIEFENFKDGVIKIAQDLTAEELATNFRAEGWTDFTQDASGYLHAVQVAVPEPAQWAVIFGTVALGFVVYRRKK